MRKDTINEIGNRYGNLVVIEFVPDKRKGAHWLCQCDCGGDHIVSGGNLRQGNVISCGCKHRLPSGISVAKSLFYSNKNSAKKRSYEWKIDFDVFLKTTQQNCFYCGSPPKNKCVRSGHNGPYIYNGIDRVDNDVGYLEDNIVPCCKSCNLAKNTMAQTEFIDWIDRLVEFRSEVNG